MLVFNPHRFRRLTPGARIGIVAQIFAEGNVMKPELLLACSLYDGTMDQLDRAYTIHRLWEAKDPAALLREVRERVRAISTMGAVGCKAEMMAALPKTEIIACFGVGVDAIDLKAAKERGIRVTNTPDVLTECVADLGMSLLLASAREIPQGDRYVREGKWPAGTIRSAATSAASSWGSWASAASGRLWQSEPRHSG
ncbi:MAG TPA: hypothetical protein VK433_07520 [Stellaceae bacterium]|nr:hypothetical protein [Stellaceae bacterium]